MDNLVARYSQYCPPVPGDDVIGYIMRGRGVSIRRKDCPNVLNLSKDLERRVEAEWTAEKEDCFFVKLHMRGADRRVREFSSGLLRVNRDTKSNV